LDNREIGQQLGQLRKQHRVKAMAACVELGILPTKSGILRAGLHALHRMEPQALVHLIKSLEPVKTGRPAKKS
jgi:hypothetical protein